jgi:hypothetical protein
MMRRPVVLIGGQRENSGGVAVAKAVPKCQDTKLSDKISTSCAGNLAVFPACGIPSSSQDLRDCLDGLVRCGVCRGLNAVDDLVRDCDTFDDDMANASCP